MGRAASRFREADIIRLLKAASKAGYASARVEIDPDGKIAVIAGANVLPARGNDFD